MSATLCEKKGVGRRGKESLEKSQIVSIATLEPFSFSDERFRVYPVFIFDCIVANKVFPLNQTMMAG